MGQKVHPIGIRLGIIKSWTSTWYAERREYANNLHQDIAARAYINEELKAAAISRIDIERPARTARVTIHSARPGVIIGKKGGDVEKLRASIGKILGVPTHVNIAEVKSLKWMRS